ncbi:MAG: hypothetical protein H6643_09705 [Caldilineaceae bacterium]|nr:hypothetical protein [Caldilineaceae bacterium]
MMTAATDVPRLADLSTTATAYGHLQPPVGTDPQKLIPALNKQLSLLDQQAFYGLRRDSVKEPRMMSETENHLAPSRFGTKSVKKDDSMNAQSLAGQWQFRQASTDEWLPATVPAASTDLLALGKFDDAPLWAATTKAAWRGWPEADWEYLPLRRQPVCWRRRSLFWSPEQTGRAGGLRSTGSCCDAPTTCSRRYEWGGQEALHDGENELAIRCLAVRFITAANAERPLLLAFRRPSTASRTCARRPATLAGIGARNAARSACGEGKDQLEGRGGARAAMCICARRTTRATS